MKRCSYNKKDAVRIVISVAKDYKNVLSGCNYIFIYKNRNNNEIGYFESAFLARNFQHLTGVEYIDSEGNIINNSLQFYQKCIESRLREAEIRFRNDGTTELKLAALPMIINFLKASKMTAIYNGVRPKLAIDRMAGTTNFCLGFTYDSCGYYVPSSALLEDIRNLADETHQILAIFSKAADKTETVYRNIRYVAKGVALDKLNFSDDLKEKVSLENYVDKMQK